MLMEESIRMSLLSWSDPIGVLARSLSSGEVIIVLGKCSLRLPPHGPLGGASISCSSVVRLDSKLGFDVDIQGPLLPASSARMLAAVLQVKAKGAYRLRGEDAEGSIWYMGDLRLQLQADEVAKVFRAKLFPNYVSVRSPKPSAQRNIETEVAIDLDVKLPAVDCNFESGAWNVREPETSAGRIQSKSLDIYHSVAGRYRVISVGGDACVTPRSLRNLLDAIAFVNGRRVDTLLTRVTSKRGTSLHIHRRRQRDEYPIPPVRWEGESGMLRAWRVLHAFWCFVEMHHGRDRPKVSQVLAELHDSQSPAYVSAKALIAVVALEGLLNCYIRGSGARTGAEIGQFKKIVSGAGLPNDVRDQCLSAIGYMARPNASGRLRALAAVGVVPNDLVGIWIRGRPKLAHGHSRHGTDDADTFLCAHTLCHATVLGLIGIVEPYEARRQGRTESLESAAIPPGLRESLPGTEEDIQAHKRDQKKRPAHTKGHPHNRTSRN